MKENAMHQPPKGSTALVVMILVAGVVVAAANAAILLLAMRASPDVSLFEGSYRLSPAAVGYSIVAPLALCALIALLVRNLAPAAPKTPAARATTPAAPSPPSPVPALRLLALLQQEGRLVDFLKEDIDGYSDAQVGAAVRSIHAGCRKALSDRIELQRIFSAEDGSEVTVEAGFDPATIRLTGNVTGKPPFRGTLQHAGWRAANVALPQSPGDTDATIIAPAEVEVP
jgi:flagellar basal body-associated protein FliL